ncbi:hypothetical protein GKZ90_0023165 [Flavobacterium sp. MC2016-06]|jgi:hypothetical protein|uniref:hypothetical protein n=1 Tax=Flavobacterium sp. MC2016-06 TaxID=2676308 RepID=UPI0012BACCBD|nr:hypothetical protein [Flavobacterium sp. MC2016-06]MBU3861632.1 hypothetical protein [Flavobacterium sp. MC2016-06]
MKKLIAFFILTALIACSNEDQTAPSLEASIKDSSVLTGKMLSFKTEESFIKEYSDLAKLNSEEIKNWVSSKKMVSLLNTSDTSKGIEADAVPESRLVYSDALEAILNSESKVKIGDRVLWLNELNFYILPANDIDKSADELLSIKNNLEVFGQLLSSSQLKKSTTGRDVLPNENRVKTFASAEMNVSGSRLRHVVDVFNETIVLNDKIYTSKMYIRSILQYRSCSTFSCSWKEASNLRMLDSDFCQSCVPGAWGVIARVSTTSPVSGTQTYQIANWAPYTPLALYPNFYILGPITCQIYGTVGFSSMELSWY